MSQQKDRKMLCRGADLRSEEALVLVLYSRMAYP